MKNIICIGKPEKCESLFGESGKAQYCFCSRNDYINFEDKGDRCDRFNGKAPVFYYFVEVFSDAYWAWANNIIENECGAVSNDCKVKILNKEFILLPKGSNQYKINEDLRYYLAFAKDLNNKLSFCFKGEDLKSYYVIKTEKFNEIRELEIKKEMNKDAQGFEIRFMNRDGNGYYVSQEGASGKYLHKDLTLHTSCDPDNYYETAAKAGAALDEFLAKPKNPKTNFAINGYVGEYLADDEVWKFGCAKINSGTISVLQNINVFVVDDGKPLTGVKIGAGEFTMEQISAMFTLQL